MPDLEALSRARIGLLLTRGFEDLLTRPQLLRAARMVAALGVVVWVGWRLFQDWNAASFPAWTPTFPVAFGAVAAGAAGLLALPLLFVAELRVAGLHRPEHRAFYARIWLQGYFFRYVPGKVLLVAERVRLGSLSCGRRCCSWWAPASWPVGAWRCLARRPGELVCPSWGRWWRRWCCSSGSPRGCAGSPV